MAEAQLPDPLFIDEPDLSDDPVRSLAFSSSLRGCFLTLSHSFETRASHPPPRPSQSQKDGFRVAYDKEVRPSPCLLLSFTVPFALASLPLRCAAPSTLCTHSSLPIPQCPFEMRLQENDETPQEVGTLEAIRCRVCVQGDAATPTAVRLELSSEQDLFFHYTHQLDERSFRAVREEQRLMIDFQDYANVLARSLNAAIKEPHTHLAVFIMNRDGNARLDFIQVREPPRRRAFLSPTALSTGTSPPPPFFVLTRPHPLAQNLEYKFVELLSVSFLRSSEAATREHISFRYQSSRARLALVQARLNDVVTLVKVKNPSLLLSLSRGAFESAPSFLPL